MIGTSVGSYHVTEALATGGMGAVFAAKHTVMGRDAVIKLLLPELSHDEEMVRRFFNEAKAAASINDPGIVQIFDVGFLPDQRAYIVMERLRGETLAHRLRTRRLTIEQTVHFLRLLARSLDAAHEHNIVHRDLKPDNIYLVKDRDVPGGERTKILDFGIAKLAGTNPTQATRAGSIFGTPAYMAPEQCSDAATVGPRADLYAIGCIAYEMLCGQPPFGYGGLELLAAHLRDTPQPIATRNPEVPMWLADVVHRLLGKSPSDRYLSAAALYAALDPSAGSEGTAATMAPPQIAAIARPSTPLPWSQPPALTTHSGAAGVMSAETTLPMRRSKLPLIFGGLVIAAGIVVATVVVVTREAAPRPAAIVSEPQFPSEKLIQDTKRAIDHRHWEDAIKAASSIPATAPEHLQAAELLDTANAGLKDRNVVDDLRAGLRRNDLAAVRVQMETLSPGSVYREEATQAVKEFEEAVAGRKKIAIAFKGSLHDPHGASTPASKPEKKSGKPRRATAPIVDPTRPTPPPPPPPSPSPPVDDGPPPDYADEVAHADRALKSQKYDLALKHALAALRARSDDEARYMATVALCGLRKPAAARTYLPKASPSYRDVALRRCEALNQTLE